VKESVLSETFSEIVILEEISREFLVLYGTLYDCPQELASGPNVEPVDASPHPRYPALYSCFV
jgi:hypothetical protein